jgi:hypothetical protein
LIWQFARGSTAGNAAERAAAVAAGVSARTRVDTPDVCFGRRQIGGDFSEIIRWRVGDALHVTSHQKRAGRPISADGWAAAAARGGKKSSPNESGTNYDALFGRGRDALVTSCRVYLPTMFAKTSLQKFYWQDFFFLFKKNKKRSCSSKRFLICPQ